MTTETARGRPMPRTVSGIPLPDNRLARAAAGQTAWALVAAESPADSQTGKIRLGVCPPRSDM